jgi:hypothetical protein
MRRSVPVHDVAEDSQVWEQPAFGRHQPDRSARLDLHSRRWILRTDHQIGQPATLGGGGHHHGSLLTYVDPEAFWQPGYAVEQQSVHS